MEISELIFKIIAYVVLILFSLMCLYPMLYALSSAFSSPEAVNSNNVVLWPLKIKDDGTYGLGVTIEAFRVAVINSEFWINYSNTFFMTFVGTIWSMTFTVLGAYALSKKRLLGRHGFNFFLVFTMWFGAGIVATFLNYQKTGNIMASLIGGADMYDMDLKWLVVIAMGTNATNLILLRNAFEGVPSEIEEAARIDGATEFQVLWQVYIPMSKATIATVALFFGIGRWNGYFWAYRVMGTRQRYSWPVQVFIRDFIENYTSLAKPLDTEDLKSNVPAGVTYNGPGANATAIVYAMVVLAIIPILVVYPFIQKYFAKGVNMGGVKE